MADEQADKRAEERYSTISHQGVELDVRLVHRPFFDTLVWQHDPTGEIYVNYLISTGPYKVDVMYTVKLTDDEQRRYDAGELDIATYCKALPGDR